jgi:hypothetical protein
VRNRTRALIEVVSRTENLILIRDLDGPVSVTNDAEAVVQMLHEMSVLGNRTLRYIDTEGVESELVHDANGRFVGFSD